MGRLPNNKVWEYFDYMSDAVAQCQICKATILTPNNRRQNMTRHLFDLHGINTYTAGSKVGLKANPSSTHRKRKLQKYVKDIGETFNTQDGNEQEKKKRIKINNEDNNEQSDDDGDDDSELENNSNRQTEEEHSTDPLLDILKIEEPIVEATRPVKKLQYPNKELNNISYGSTLNQSNNNLTNPLEHSHSTLDSQNEAELLKAKALTEKLKAEARYFNELAELTRSKRIYVDMQCQQLRNQINGSATNAANFNSTTNLTESFFPTDI